MTNDSRIQLVEAINSKKEVLVYPKSSFTVDSFVEMEGFYGNVLVNSTMTPNTFITYLENNFCMHHLRCTAVGGSGLYHSFFYYESTVWLLKKNQKEQIPFFFSLQTISMFSNIRWVFIQKPSTIKLESTSKFFPAAVWPEREIQDMFSVSFQGLQDTRRLLLDYKLSRGVMSPKYKLKGVSLFSPFYDIYYI